MSKTKVLISLLGKSFGGYENQLLLAIQRLHKSIQFILVCPPGPVRKTFEPHVALVLPPPENWEVLIKDYHPDVVVTVQGNIFGLAAAAYQSAIPSVWICGYPPRLLPNAATLQALCHPLFQEILVPSDHLKNELTFLSHPQVTHWRCGVEPKNQWPAPFKNKVRSSLGIPPQVFVFGYAARYAPHKRQLDLIETLTHLPEAHVVLLGWGDKKGTPYFEKIWHAAKEKNLIARTHIVQSLPNEIEYFLSCLDVFVSSAENEGLGCAVLEAMAIGLPIVAADSGGVSEPLAFRRCGELYPVGNITALSHTLDQLRKDPDRRKQWGNIAKQVVNTHYSADRMADQFQSILQKWAAKRLAH